MAVTHKDRYTLSTDPTFKTRVQAALIASCVSIANEGWAVAFHRERANYAAQILAAPSSPIDNVQLFTNSVSTDATCIADATAAGTVVLSGANVATQAALVTDAHIDSAISAEFNAYIRGIPGN